MSLSAARFPVPHVGAARNQGLGSGACADPKIRGLLWRRQFEHRAIRANDVPHFQRRDLQDLSQAFAAPAHSRTPHDRRVGQCSVSSREAPGQISSQQRTKSALAVPAALQSSVGSNRTRLETDSAARHAQPLLCHAARSAESRQRLLRPVATSKPGSASTMLHYLRRCV